MALGVANLATDFSSRIVTLLAFIAAAASLGLAVELWYVSHRIERSARFVKPHLVGAFHPNPLRDVWRSGSRQAVAVFT